MDSYQRSSDAPPAPGSNDNRLAAKRQASPASTRCPSGTPSMLPGIICLLVFALGILQFALLPSLKIPPSRRTNNGRQATFFAVTISPYYVFSEDYQLYYIRARRVLDRGWQASLLRSQNAGQRNHSGIIQVGLGMLALQTGGHTVSYSLLMSAVCFIAWSFLFVSALRWLPGEVGWRVLVLSVLVTVLFQSVKGMGGVILSHPNFELWPLNRALRLSTIAWSSPVMLAAILAATHCLFQPLSSRTVTVLGCMLLFLAASDNWAFLMAWTVSSLVFAILALQIMLRRSTNSPVPASARWLYFLLFLELVASIGLQRWLGRSIQGDILLRAGLGHPWKAAPGGFHFGDLWFRSWLYPTLGATLSALLIVAANRRRLLYHPIATMLASITAALALLTILHWIGMESYLANEIYWRVDFCVLFGVILVALIAIRDDLNTRIALDIPQSSRHRPVRVVMFSVVFLGLLAYHNWRLFAFVSHTAAGQFFLTRDEENLHEWLNRRPNHSLHWTIATLNHEINYLCADWTSADLLLPEGFPYHNGGSNKEIFDQFTDLLRFYRVPPHAWLQFDKEGAGDDQLDWNLGPTGASTQYSMVTDKARETARAKAAGEGYLYYLFHRAIYLDGYTVPQARRFSQRIAVELDHSPKVRGATLQPDLIILDTVSQLLGHPDLTSYQLAFRSGSIEVWELRSLSSSNRR